MSRSTVFAILAIAFFTVPLTARVLGVTAEEFENRRFADAPALSQGWSAFQQASRFLTDRMPLRAQAVRANTRIWQDVFGADPRYGTQRSVASDQALPFAGIRDLDKDEAWRKSGGLQGVATATTGTKGWLFLDDMDAWCGRPPDTYALSNWGALIRAVREGGRPATMLVVPNKESVYPEYLPDTPRRKCGTKQNAKWWALIAKRGPALGVLELRSELLRLKRRAGDDLYEVTDLHWTPLGALTMVGAALDELGNGIQVEAKEVVRRGPVPYEGNLDAVSGRMGKSTHFVYDVVRDPDAPQVPGKTVVIGDSFAYGFKQLFKPYFEELQFVSLYQPDDATDEVVRAIRSADQVVFAAVQTNFEGYADYADLVVPALASPLDRQRPAAPPVPTN